MAKLNGIINFSGSLGDLSAYTMRGVDKVIIRKKGGASRDKIKNSPAFERTRENNAEWGGCSKAGTHIRVALSALRQLADYNISGSLNSLAKAIQKLDTNSKRGQRSILISAHKHSLEGFSLNKKTRFEGVVRQPLTYSISRDDISARVQVPDLIPSLNFFAPPGSPVFFRIIATLGIVPDMVFTGLGYQPANKNMKLCHESAVTAWAPTTKGSASQILEIKLTPNSGLDPSGTLVLSVGFELGIPAVGGTVTPIPYMGCAKILAVN